MNICFFGDSIGYGAYDTHSGGWVDRLKAHYFSDVEKDISIYNLCISGNTTKALLAEEDFLREARVREAAVLVFAIGINDSIYTESEDRPWVSLSDFKKNLSQIVEQAKELTPHLLFVGLTPIEESKTQPVSWQADAYYKAERVRIYDSALQEFCRQGNHAYVSVEGAIPLEDIIDGVHPGPNGHQKISEKVRLALDHILSQ